MMFGICIFFILIGIKRALFTKEYFRYDPSKIIYYIQSIFKPRKYKTLFIIIATAYFIFFGFLSSVLIFFNNDGTVFSLFPNHTHDNMNMNMNMNMKNMNMNIKN